LKQPLLASGRFGSWWKVQQHLEAGMKLLITSAAALFVGSTMCGYAAEKGIGNSGPRNPGASQYAPGQLPKGAEGHSQWAPGQEAKKPGATTGRGGASELSPGDRMNDARGHETR